jgi:hypothetical protein
VKNTGKKDIFRNRLIGSSGMRLIRVLIPVHIAGDLFHLSNMPPLPTGIVKVGNLANKIRSQRDFGPHCQG